MDKAKLEAATRMILEAVSHPADDPNTIETPKRVAKMYAEILNGYETDPLTYVKTFPSENNEMVVVRNIPFYSYCAHHFQPFYGRMTIAYIPGGQVLGLSKLVRIGRVFAKRFQLQEDLTQQIAYFLQQNVPDCGGVAVSIRSSHMCMVIRGARAHGSETVTTKFTGQFLDSPTKSNKENRDRFYSLLSDKQAYA